MPVTFTFGEMLSARSVIGTTLAELGDDYDNLWVLTPDIGATLVEFRDKFPERFLDVGLAEQVCVGIAAGLAYDGNIPVVSGMLPFLSMRALEQVRSDVCYPNLPVKIIGTHGGLVGNGGSTHYAVEDLALMCALTNMTVTSIGDPLMVGEIIRQSMTMQGPIYIRLAVGKKDKVLYEPGEHDIRIGKGIVAREGTDATIFTHGTVVAQALDAAEELAKDGRSVRVVDMFTLKPIDEELIVRCAAETGGRFVVARGPPRLRRPRHRGSPTSSPTAACASPPSSGSASPRSTPASATTRSCATSTATAWRRRSPPPAG